MTYDLIEVYFSSPTLIIIGLVILDIGVYRESNNPTLFKKNYVKKLIQKPRTPDKIVLTNETRKRLWDFKISTRNTLSLFSTIEFKNLVQLFASYNLIIAKLQEKR